MVFLLLADKNTMKYFFILFMFLFVSCGKTALDRNPNSAVSSLNSNQICQCTSEYFPVCASSGKSYDNQCLANCFNDRVLKVGQCKCRNDFMICGTDNNEYTECEAQEKNISIKKFSPCSAQPI